MTSGFHDLTTQELIQRMLAPERAAMLDPLSILSFSEVNYWDMVADIGCGPGYFTVPLAKSVINGKVYALDIDDEMLDACRKRVAQARLGNVEVLKCEEFQFPIEPGSLNRAFLAFVVHHSSDRSRFLAAVRQLLRPQGWCTILEWQRVETGAGPPLERRIDPKEVEEMVKEVGFRCRGWRNINSEHYMMTLRNQ